MPKSNTRNYQTLKKLIEKVSMPGDAKVNSLTINGHDSPIGTIIQSAEAQDVSISTTWLALTSITLQPGSWLITFRMRTKEESMTSGWAGAMACNVSTTAGAAGIWASTSRDYTSSGGSGSSPLTCFGIQSSMPVEVTSPTTYYLNGRVYNKNQTIKGSMTYMRAIRIA